MILLLQIPQIPAPPAPGPHVPMSGEWASPTSWATLFQTAGVPAAILIFVFAMLAVFGGATLWFTIGPKGLLRVLGVRFVARLSRFLASLEKNLTATHTALAEHMQNCKLQHAPGGAGCVHEIRQAAPLVVAGLREMAGTMEIPEAVAHFSAAAEQLQQMPPQPAA